MNRFEQEYIKIINEWNSNLLLEANLKSLIPNIQQKLIGNRSYNDLTDKEKENLQNDIKLFLDTIKTNVDQITDNKQYQSWIYNCLKNNEITLTSNDVNKLKSLLLEFTRLCKRPDLKPNQRNIENYKSLNDLLQFIDSFKTEHKLQNNIYKNLEKIYSNKEFTVYSINKDQYEECNKLFGRNEYFNTGWCIAKNEEHFNDYLENYYYHHDAKPYFIFIKDNKPYALLHYGSVQFKDTSDEALKVNNPNIIDCLYNLDNNLDMYNAGDLQYYKYQIFSKIYPNLDRNDYIAQEIKGIYDPKTKTIDCKDKRIIFKDAWFDENGTFDFTITNATNDWSDLFSGCHNLIKLPDNFIIPKNIIDCQRMFLDCKNLKELPENFTITSNVGICDYMFYGCKNLTKLPENFSLPHFCTYRSIFENSGLDGKIDLNTLIR